MAIAVLWRGGELLLRRRLADETLPGVWEFPGGKIRSGESPEAAARREIREEMGSGIDVGELRLRETIEHDYPDRRVRLFVLEGTCRGEPVASDGADWAWLAPSELARRAIPSANRELVVRLMAGN